MCPTCYKEGQTAFRVCIVGAGFSGAILAKQLERAGLNIEVMLFEKTDGTDIGASETGTGLNLNPNGMAALRELDPTLENEMRACGLPRSRLRSSTMSGSLLYDVPIYDEKEKEGVNLADAPGLRIRWRDAYTVIRKSCSKIIYGCQVRDYYFDPKTNKASISVLHTQSGELQVYSNFDMVVSADGRYSVLREQAIGTPETRLAGVCNFRVLIDDTSNGLFDDMELIYNTCPSMAKLTDEERNDPEVQYCFTGFPRIGIMKMPASATCDHESLYVFGNFAVKGMVPEATKTQRGILALYTPSEEEPDQKGRYIIRVLEENAHRLHWARMQKINFLYRDASGRLLFLGDSAHAMVPTLGQGATMAIEDACVAAQEIISAVSHSRTISHLPVDVALLTERIEHRCLSRSEFVSATSEKATEHLRGGNISLEGDVCDWTSEESHEGEGGCCFRKAMREVWRNYPKVYSAPVWKILPQHIV